VYRTQHIFFIPGYKLMRLVYLLWISGFVCCQCS